MIKELSRQEKERLYIRKMTELQIRWGNSINDDWNFSDWTNEQLDNSLGTTIGQLKFEKGISFFKKFFLYSVYIFIVFGIIGLLVFGIRQLF